MKTLITLKNLMPYTPENTDNVPDDALFLKSDENADWYQAIIHFSPDTLKVMYDRNNVIVDANMDASRLWPYGLSVSEVAIDAVPQNFRRPEQHSMGLWVYQDGVIIPRVITREEQIARAEKTKAGLIDAAMKSVATIQLKLQAGRKLTEEEMAKLNLTLDYIDEVEATDISNAPAIDWPESPIAS